MFSVIPNRAKTNLERADELYKKKDYSKAIDMYKQALPWAFPQLGFFYMRGIGCEQDLKLSIKYFKETLVKLKDFPPEVYSSLVNLGVIYSQLKEYDEALCYHKKALQLKNHDADIINNIGYIYKCLGNAKKAIQWYETAANRGEAYSKFFLAQMYEVGDLVERNTKISRQWYSKLFKESATKQLYSIAKNFLFGYDCFKRNLKESKFFFEKAYEKGFIEMNKTKKEKEKSKIKRVQMKAESKVRMLQKMIHLELLKENFKKISKKQTYYNCIIRCKY